MDSTRPIEGWDRWFPAYLRDVHFAPGDFRPNYREYSSYEQFYQDDRQISGAALQLHPLLGKDTVAAILAELRPPSQVPRGRKLIEFGRRQSGIWLMLSGGARLVASVNGGARTRQQVVVHYQSGQWMGLTQLLHEYDRVARPNADWPGDRLSLEVEVLGRLGVQELPFDRALALMRDCEDFRRFVEHHVAVRFARRQQVIELIDGNPFLRLLSPPMREYLMQLGAIVTPPAGTGNPPVYMAQGEPSGRVAFVLEGQATMWLEHVRTSHKQRSGTFRPGDLIGHEGMVMADELEGSEEPGMVIVEPPRNSEIRLHPDAEVLEFFWYAMRWVFDDRASIWQRVQMMLTQAVTDLAPAELVSFQGAQRGLGTTTLAYGTGAVLAERGESVWVLDLQGPDNYEDLQELGFTRQTRTLVLRSPVRRQRALNRANMLTYFELRPPLPSADQLSSVSWPTRLKVIWPERISPRVTDELLNALEARDDVSHIIVVGLDSSKLEPSTDDNHWIFDYLNDRCRFVFRVADDSTASYPDIEPSNLVWVYRMTPAYLARERQRARQVPIDWRYASLLERAPAFVRHRLEKRLGSPIGEELRREQDAPGRREIRVPDDPEGARMFSRGELTAMLGRPDLPLTRAFQRLVRAVEQQTVGLALGGGGAWGFSHLALLSAMKEDGVPIDYIAGTSFGSIVGALYAAGGLPVLEQLVAENSASRPGFCAALAAIARGRLTRYLLVAPLFSPAIDMLIDAQLRDAGVTEGEPVCLGATEIPFYPVGTDLQTYRPLSGVRSTVGFGVRMSSSLPPLFATVRRASDSISDGGYVANVPSRVVRRQGAHFVISANVVPPTPPDMASTGRLSQRLMAIPRRLFKRQEDAMRGFFVQSWKGGQDQGELAADYALDLRPSEANFFEMWRGATLVEEIEEKHFSGANRGRIGAVWRRFRRGVHRTTARAADHRAAGDPETTAR